MSTETEIETENENAAEAACAEAAGAAGPGAGEAVPASPREVALVAARAASEKKATDIVVQDVGELIGVTDYFVIVTAANSRQVNAIIDAIEEAERLQAHVKPLHREETRDGSWELLDYGSVVVHVFQPETREFYRLEALWNDAPVLDLAAEAGLADVEYSDRVAALLDGRADEASSAGPAVLGEPVDGNDAEGDAVGGSGASSE